MKIKNIILILINIATLGVTDALRSKRIAILWCFPPIFFTFSSLNDDYLSPLLFEMKYLLFMLIPIFIFIFSIFSYPVKKISRLVLMPLFLISYSGAYYVPKHLGITIGDGTSMLPTLKPGELLIYKDIDIHDRINRGDMILFKLEEKNQDVVKRVFAIEGDKVRVTEKKICIVDGQCIEDKTMPLNFFRWEVVRKNTFYVLGDNIPVSLDSRYFKEPLVKRKDIFGVYIGKAYLLNKLIHYFLSK